MKLRQKSKELIGQHRILVDQLDTIKNGAAEFSEVDMKELEDDILLRSDKIEELQQKIDECDGIMFYIFVLEYTFKLLVKTLSEMSMVGVIKAYIRSICS